MEGCRMNSNYEYKWFEALKKDREDNARILEKPSMEGFKRSVSEKYSEQAHFVYELLQNASDAKATKIQFILDKNGLIFKHNGSVRFSISNPQKEKEDKVIGKLGHINSITSIGQSSKGSDEIGKFGVGFKAVFQYTETPEIYDSKFRFKIERFIVPVKIGEDHKLREKTETLFYFPFNLSSKSSQEAYNEIKERLRQLENPLLFLAIDKIEWECEDNNEQGVYRKDIKEKQTYLIIDTIEKVNGNTSSKKFLVFKPDINNKDAKDVRIAYPIVEENGQIAVKSNRKYPAYYFFPTKESTELKFILHAHFDLTDNRESIKKNKKWNDNLIDELALLVAKSLPIVRDIGLLNVDFLNTLPLDSNSLNEKHLFRPVYDAVVKKLRSDEKLLPTNDGTFIPARNAKLASADWLRKLLTSDQLRDLFSSKYQPNWLSSEITQKRTSDLKDYLINELDVEEVTPDSFASRIEGNFLANQTDKWIIELYKYLNKVPHLWEPDHFPPLSFRSKPIIRTEEAEKVMQIAPYIHRRKYYVYGGSYITEVSNNVFLPPEDETSFTIVKRCIATDHEARQFLRNLGLEEPDIYNEIYDNILPKYCSDIEISSEKHKRHMNTVLRAIRSGDEAKRNKLIEKIKSSRFIRFMSAINSGTNVCHYKQPKDLYFQTEDLKIFFKGNSDIWFINEELTESSQKSFIELGVSDIIRIENRKRDDLKEIRIVWENKHKVRGVNGFDYRCKIDGLEYALGNPSFEKSQFIWNHLLSQHIDSIKGTIESKKDGRYVYADFVADKPEVKYSLMGQLLIEKPWLPDKNYQFHKPCELGLDDLPESFKRDEKLVDQLEMKKDITAKLMKEAGVSKYALGLAKELERQPQDIREKIESLLQKNTSQSESLQKTSTNHERRKEKIIEKTRSAPKKNYEKKPRTIKTTENVIEPKIWLRETYTDNNRELNCQICNKVMPFKKKDGEYYFEAVEIVNDIDKEMEELHLALCPLCAAMYKEFIKRDKDAMEHIKGDLIAAHDLEIPIQLGDKKARLCFVEKHFNDLKVILRELSGNTD